MIFDFRIASSLPSTLMSKRAFLGFVLLALSSGAVHGRTLETSTNGTETFVWTIQDTYAGHTFFE